MTLTEYYNLPEGTNIALRYTSFFDTVSRDCPCPKEMYKAFNEQNQRKVVKKLYLSNTVRLENMFDSCEYLQYFEDIENWDVSAVTNMRNLFIGCTYLKNLKGIENWDVSAVTDLSQMCQNCSNLLSLDLSRWDTSKVKTFESMCYGCNKLTSFGAINCSGLSSKNYYPIRYYSDCTTLTELGGFIGAKASWDNTYGLCRLPNLTYQSCINILNGLHDFTAAGETPSSSQGALKVHANFLTTVGDEISIGTNKGWTITT